MVGKSNTETLVRRVATTAKNVLLLFVQFLLVYFVAAYVSAAIEWLKPYTVIEGVPAYFVVLEPKGETVTTKKYDPKSSCDGNQLFFARMAPKSEERIGHSNYFYTLLPLAKGAVRIQIHGGVDHYEYLIADGCIRPLRQKTFSIWTLVAAFGIAVVIVFFTWRVAAAWIKSRWPRKSS